MLDSLDDSVDPLIAERLLRTRIRTARKLTLAAVGLWPVPAIEAGAQAGGAVESNLLMPATIRSRFFVRSANFGIRATK